MKRSNSVWAKCLGGLLAFGVLAGAADAAQIGQQLTNPKLRDANDGPASIPGFGQKVLAIFYTDPDVSDQNDAFADMLHKAKLPEAKYKGIGVANMADTWLPNSVIRSIVRRKIEKYGSTILTDPELLLAKAWGLGSCNDQSVVIILDKTGKVAWQKKGALSPAEQKEAFAKVQQLINQ